MKITHVHRSWHKDQTLAGKPGEDGVWQDLRYTTMVDEGVLFIDSYEGEFEFFEELEKGIFDRELVKELSLDPSKR